MLFLDEERCYPQKARDVPCNLNATDEEKAVARARLGVNK